MKLINLVIADEDKDYVHCLVEYIMLYQADKFAVAAFTNAVPLLRHLEEGLQPPEILLVGEEFFLPIQKISPEKCGLVIVLTKGTNRLENGDGERTINKYQYGEKIVGELLRLLAAETATEYSFRQTHLQQRTTQIIGVFSPVGGTGKTTLAVGASIQMAWEGKSCFYLNLENMGSTSLYLAGEQEENFSGILYYLKNKTTNLSLYLEKAKCIDPATKVAYYQPADSIIDFKEDISKELKLLLRELSGTGQYERIFIDLSSEINKNNLAVLRACDRILLVVEQNCASLIKIRNLFRELRLLTDREGWNITDRFVFVFNKVDAGESMADEAEKNYVEEAFGALGNGGGLWKIPLVKELTLFQNGSYRLDLNTEFGRALYQLLQAL